MIHFENYAFGHIPMCQYFPPALAVGSGDHARQKINSEKQKTKGQKRKAKDRRSKAESIRRKIKNER